MSEWKNTTPERLVLLVVIVVLVTGLGVFVATGGFGMFETL